MSADTNGDALTPKRKRTQKARAAALAKIPPEQRVDHFRKLGEKSGADRLTLSGTERDTLFATYDLLPFIVARHRPEPEGGAS